jgi:hypothetical protein
MRKTSNAVLAGAFACLATAPVCGSAFAAPCNSGTLDNYLVAGFSCTLGHMTFSNVFYNGAGTGAAAAAVGVTPVSFPKDVGLLFNGPWNAPPSSTEDVAINFTVAVTDPTTNPALIGEAFLQILVGNGIFSDTESFSATDQLLIASDIQPHTLSFPASSSVDVRDDLVLNPSAEATQIEKLFLDPVVIPEPISLALVGVGLTALGLVQWRTRWRRLG